MPVIKQAWTVNVEPLQDLAQFAATLGQVGFEIFEQAGAEIAPLMLEDLKTYPPVPSGSRYIRTGRLRDNWFVHIGQSGAGQFKFEVTNSTDYAVWVVGSLAQARDAAARFQRDFHKAHGWLLATDTVTIWFRAFLEEYQSRFEDRLAAFGGFTLTRRARTSLR